MWMGDVPSFVQENSKRRNYDWSYILNHIDNK